jgi:hypothetical protein
LSENLSLTQRLRYGRISQEEYDEELIERNAHWRSLSPPEQLAALDRRLGKGVGAARQRKILAEKLSAPPASAVVVAELPAAATPVVLAKKKFKKGNKK